jgi:hypothetical protein
LKRAIILLSLGLATATAQAQKTTHPIIYVSQSGGVVDKQLYNALRHDVAQKYALLSSESPAVVGADLKREGYYWIGINSGVFGTASGTKVVFMYSAYTTHGQMHVEYPLHDCKTMNVTDCAKEAFDYLDSIVQHDQQAGK